MSDLGEVEVVIRLTKLRYRSVSGHGVCYYTHTTEYNFTSQNSVITRSSKEQANESTYVVASGVPQEYDAGSNTAWDHKTCDHVLLLLVSQKVSKIAERNAVQCQSRAAHSRCRVIPGICKASVGINASFTMGPAFSSKGIAKFSSPNPFLVSCQIMGHVRIPR